jgi:hypothetical protein
MLADISAVEIVAFSYLKESSWGNYHYTFILAALRSESFDTRFTSFLPISMRFQ